MSAVIVSRLSFSDHVPVEADISLENRSLVIGKFSAAAQPIINNLKAQAKKPGANFSVSEKATASGYTFLIEPQSREKPSISFEIGVTGHMVVKARRDNQSDILYGEIPNQNRAHELVCNGYIPVPIPTRKILEIIEKAMNMGSLCTATP